MTPDLINDLRRIDGYSDLFGPQDFCDCPHCRSVLGPAAYFTDLMHFVETNVSRPVFINPGKTTHPLYLKNRRPDLWTLPVTCANTNTLVPYLTIVNEVLESYLRKVVDGDIYATLADPRTKVSFRVPFNLPFAELGVYLSHFELSPADVYRRLRQPDDKVWRARLEPVARRGRCRHHARPHRACWPASGCRPRSPTIRSSSSCARPVSSAKSSTTCCGWPSTATSTTSSSPSRYPPGELQNFPEVLQGLTAARVDFLHRFLRLWRSTQWTIEQLDLLLVSLQYGRTDRHRPRQRRHRPARPARRAAACAPPRRRGTRLVDQPDAGLPLVPEAAING